MPKLIFDIETAGDDFETLDTTTREVLTRYLKRESESEEEYQIALAELKSGLGFSPLTGQVIAVGVLDFEKTAGAVYFQAPEENIPESEEEGIKFKAMGEKEMLSAFWNLALRYDEFISFNGRAFDAPFLAVRSAVHAIKPTKDLLSNRYLGSQKSGALHVDLLDQLSFYGSLRKRGNLHLWSRIFGIKSPKAGGVTGEEVGRLFKERRFLDIARYNLGDLRATKELYDHWQKYLRF